MTTDDHHTNCYHRTSTAVSVDVCDTVRATTCRVRPYRICKPQLQQCERALKQPLCITEHSFVLTIAALRQAVSTTQGATVLQRQCRLNHAVSALEQGCAVAPVVVAQPIALALRVHVTRAVVILHQMRRDNSEKRPRQSRNATTHLALANKLVDGQVARRGSNGQVLRAQAVGGRNGVRALIQALQESRLVAEATWLGRRTPRVRPRVIDERLARRCGVTASGTYTRLVHPIGAIGERET